MITFDEPPQAVLLANRRPAWVVKRGRRWAQVIYNTRPVRIARVPLQDVEDGIPCTATETQHLQSLLLDKASQQYPDVLPPALKEALYERT